MENLDQQHRREGEGALERVAYFLPKDSKVKAEGEKDRELEYLRGKVATYETALRLLVGERGIEVPLTVVK